MNLANERKLGLIQTTLVDQRQVSGSASKALVLRSVTVRVLGTCRYTHVHVAESVMKAVALAD